MNYAREIARILSALAQLPEEEISGMLSTPPGPDLGDVAFPCFGLSKKLGKPPGKMASELAARINPEGLVQRVEAVGPYINFYLNRLVAGSLLVEDILKSGTWGSSDRGKGQTVCIDFCSPNIAKPMHLGHLRSIVIGNALARLHASQGFEVIRINFVGDWGTQFGRLIAAWKRWGDPGRINNDPVGELLRVYVQFHRQAKEDPRLEEEGRQFFRLLEAGDPETLAVWSWIRESSLHELQKALSFLGVEFDLYESEAGYADAAGHIVEELKNAYLLAISEGASVVELPDLPPCLILKSDGTSLYATRDIAAALSRQERFAPARSLYVTDKGQSLHFKQVFGVLQRMGYGWSRRLEHVPFGLMRVKGKRLKTREGDVVYLDDVLGQAVDLARNEIRSRSAESDDIEEIARAVGIGAVIFNDLKNNRKQDIDYSPETALSFDGETGPYVQYAHARCASILKRTGDYSGNTAGSPEAFAGEHEWALLAALESFPGAARAATEDCEPHIVARKLIDVAKAFNHFYHDCPILRAEEGLRAARISLVRATATTLRYGLWLLGIEAPRMRGEE